MGAMSDAPGLPLRLYRNVSPVLSRAVELLGPFSAKLATGLAGRRGLMPRLLAAAPRVRGGVWFHVTSVGEYEQAINDYDRAAELDLREVELERRIDDFERRLRSLGPRPATVAGGVMAWVAPAPPSWMGMQPPRRRTGEAPRSGERN